MSEESKDLRKERELADNPEETLAQSVREKLAHLPLKPGVYQFKNEEGTVIYVGKAIKLRNRVRSYFQQGRVPDAKTRAMTAKIADLEVIVTDSEAEALILEDVLIKKLKPKYNINLRDDKSYPFVRITNEDFPRIFPTRKLIRDGSKYFGPFTEVKQLRRLMNVVRTIFNIRSCDLKLTKQGIDAGKFKICLDYHIEKCGGPCAGFVSKEEYNENIKLAAQILLGKTRPAEKMLEEKMEALAEKMKFEEAAIVRNRLQALRDYSSHQKVVSIDMADKDVFALARINEDACSIMFKIREGKLVGKKHYIIKRAMADSDEVIMQRTVEKWYLDADYIPPVIDMQTEPADMEILAEWLGKKRGRSISMHIPKTGERKKLINMAVTNAEFLLREYHIALDKRDQSVPRPVLSLQRDLRMKNIPRRIECIDNSHIQGSELVSSLVVFEDGKPKKSDYRKFKIRTVAGNDDFASMREVVERRYAHHFNGDTEKKKDPLPDLLIIDGGKGQLSSAIQVLRDIGFADSFQVIGLAKKLEEVYFPGEPDPLQLPKTSSSLKLLQQLRDEAHRFAITYHRLLRDKRTLKTELSEIKGVGEKTAAKLLTEFGSVKSIKEQSLAELEKKVNKKAAKAVFDYFHSQENKANEGNPS